MALDFDVRIIYQRDVENSVLRPRNYEDNPRISWGYPEMDFGGYYRKGKTWYRSNEKWSKKSKRKKLSDVIPVSWLNRSGWYQPSRWWIETRGNGWTERDISQEAHDGKS